MIVARVLGECYVVVRPPRGRAHTKRHGRRPAFVDRDGYPRCWDPDRRRQVLVHRYVYERMIRPLVEGECVHHTCHVRACVNPTHLRAMPRGDHARLHARLRAERASG